MEHLYIFNYQNNTIGVYNKLCYLFDYIIELMTFNYNMINLDNITIKVYEINKGYPSNILKFNVNRDLNKLYLVEKTGKRVEMIKETFERYKIIQNIFNSSVKNILRQNQFTPIQNVFNTPLKDNIIKMKTEIEDEKRSLVTKLNKLKKEKKIVFNWKNKYETDLKLYHDFTQKIKEDPEFKIPEMFEKYYKFFENHKSFVDYFYEFNPDSELDTDILNELLEIESEEEDSET